MATKWGICALCAIVLSLTGGCAALQYQIDNDDAKVRLVFTIATMKLIKGDPQRAEAVIDRANRVMALLDGNPLIILVDFDSEIKKAIGYDTLPIEDQIVAQMLLNELRADVDKAIGEPGDKGSPLARARTVIGWIRNAAESWLAADEVRRNQERGIWIPGPAVSVG